MSYEDHSRRAGYNQGEGDNGGGQFGGYERRGGEADDYYNDGGRPSRTSGGGTRYEEGDGRGADYSGRGSGRSHEDDSITRGYGAGGNYDDKSGGDNGPYRGDRDRYEHDTTGGGLRTHQSGEQRFEEDNLGRDYGGSYESYGSRGGFGKSSYGYDPDEAIKHAQRHGDGEDGNLFSQALSFLGENKHHADEDIDEQQMIGAHQQLYGKQDDDRPHDARSLGAGAAMQALKIFTSGGAGAGEVGSQAHGNSQSQFIGMAMAQAGKLFDQQSGQGKVASGADKQSAVNNAAKLALQMYMKSGSQGGGRGPGGLMGLANKFI